MMTNYAIKAMGGIFESAIENMENCAKFEKSFDGAYGFICKYWDTTKGVIKTEEAETKVSYASICKAFGINKPKELKKYLRDLLALKGLHESLVATKVSKDGTETLCAGLVSTRTIKVEEVTVKDADGKDTHPTVYVCGKKGKLEAAKCEVLRPISKQLTPSMLMKLLVQNEAAKAGAVAYTYDDFVADYEVKQNEDGKYVAEKPVETKKPVAKGTTKPVTEVVAA